MGFRFNKTALILFIITIISGSSLALAEGSPEESIVSFYLGDKGKRYALVVEKATQTLYLYDRDNTEIIRMSCSTGKSDGRKLQSGDAKTPEGIYFFTKSYVKKYLSPIYGIRAFPIDYPNPVDKKEGRNGYGIWFHGTNKPLKPRDTNGCIVMEDASIDHLASYIKLHETPTVISSRVMMVPESEREKEAKRQKKAVRSKKH